jgi:hypothetical protein
MELYAPTARNLVAVHLNLLSESGSASLPAFRDGLD